MIRYCIDGGSFQGCRGHVLNGKRRLKSFSIAPAGPSNALPELPGLTGNLPALQQGFHKKTLHPFEPRTQVMRRTLEKNLFSGVMPHTWHPPVEKIFLILHQHQLQREARMLTVFQLPGPSTTTAAAFISAVAASAFSSTEAAAATFFTWTRFVNSQRPSF